MGQPKLKPVANDTAVSALLKLLVEMEGLRTEIGRAIGDHQSINLALGKDGLSFDMTITLNAGDDGKIATYLLDKQPVPGCRFTNITAAPVPHTVNRRAIRAQIVVPEGAIP